MRFRVAIAAGVLLGLTGCAAHADDPTIAVGSPSPSASTVPSSSQAAPIASSAAPVGELARFDRVARAVVAADPAAHGRAFIDALVRAGFDKTAMQVTADRTSVGLPAPSVQFSVLVGGTCLIGQYGPESGGYHGITAAPVGGRCLIGRTRPIDW